MSKIERIVTFTLIAVAAILAIVNWRKAGLFSADNEQLRAKLVALEAELEETIKDNAAVGREAELQRQRNAELMRLRNEVTQLRSASNTVQTLTLENQRLKTEVQQLRGRAGQPAQAAAQAPAVAQFPRESWQFAGYNTPEAALLSALWAMKEGNPQAYLESLSPAEQQRAAESWQNMNQEQLSAKHKNDVANITAMRILEHQNLAPDEILMTVYLDGPGRMERIRMNQVGQEWKFSGFVRQGPGAPPQQ